MTAKFNVKGKVKSFAKTSQTQLLPIRPAMPMFHLLYHPYRYMWGGKNYGWLPDIGQMFLTPGANGVAEGGNDRRAIMNVEDNGCSIIKIADLPEELQGCVSESKTRSGETHYHWSWVSYVVVGSRLSAKKEPNAKKDFLKQLVDLQVVPEIDPDVEEILVDEMQDRLRRLQSKAALKPADVVLKNEISRIETALTEIADSKKAKK